VCRRARISGCINPGCHVAWANTFCTGVPNYLWIFSMELASPHLYGAHNFEMVHRFFESLCAPVCTSTDLRSVVKTSLYATPLCN
jgi:hypothetical protein